MKATRMIGVLPCALLTTALAFYFGPWAYSQTVDSLNPAPNNYVFTTMPTPDGGILIGGAFTKIGGQAHNMVARLLQDGTTDSSFTNGFGGGYESTYVQCLAMQTNGQVVVGGSFSWVNTSSQSCWTLCRFNPDGTVDTHFALTSTNWNDASVSCLALQPDGKILVGCVPASGNSTGGGKTPGALHRLNPDGTLDANFTTVVDSPVYSLALQPDGKILAVGNFSSIDNQGIADLARLNAGGSVDPGFLPSSFARNGNPGSAFEQGGVVQVQPDGKILVGGMFDSVNGQSHTNIVRFSADGSIDPNFHDQTSLSGLYGAQTLALQANGKILVAHDFKVLDGKQSIDLVRLNADGSLDASFATNPIAGGSLYDLNVASDIVLQADGKILAGGAFASIDGRPRNYLGRLCNNEPATQSLNFDGTNITWLRGGASPEVWRTSFESSTDGVHWTYLGDGSRMAGGWQLTNVAASADAEIRARGFLNGGQFNGSAWFVETIYPTTPAWFVTTNGNFGCGTNGFACGIGGSAGSAAEIDGSSDLIDWTPLATNYIYSGTVPFIDPSSTNYPQRFYRIRMQ